MFLFNVYMYVIYISTCIDIINSVYLFIIFNYGLVALVLCILHHVVCWSTKGNNKKQQPPPSKNKKKAQLILSGIPLVIGMHILQYLLFKVFQIIIPG